MTTVFERAVEKEGAKNIKSATSFAFHSTLYVIEI